MAKYKPDYIRVEIERKDMSKESDLNGLELEIKREKPTCGSFARILESEEDHEKKWILLEFNPHSKDLNPSWTNYQTREIALLNALEYLKGKGFRVGTIPLKEMIDRYDGSVKVGE